MSGDSMSQSTKHTYEFGPFRIDSRERLLFRDGEIVPLPPKIFDTLLALVEGNGHLLDKDELIKHVWPDTFVEEGNLTRNVSTLRSVLGEGENGHHYIETIPRRGYRFVAGVKELVDEDADLILQERTRSTVTIEEESSQGILESARESTARSVEMVAARTSSSTEYLITEIKRHKSATLIVATALAVAGAGITFGLFKLFSKPRVPFQTPSIVKLTTTGKAVAAAISPDGKYVVYAEEEADRQSLWVRQVVAANSKQIIPPAEIAYTGLTFSPDSNFLYYVTREMFSPGIDTLKANSGVLYQMPALGGASRKLIQGVSSPVTFSPDGKRLAFVRREPGQGSKLMLANADGMGEPQVLAARKSPEFFTLFPSHGLAWSPDGKTIVCSGGDDGGFGQMYPIGVRVADGAQRQLTTKRWQQVTQMAWLADGSALLMNARDSGTDAHPQIWHVSYPGGESRRIYNDFNSFNTLSLTATSDKLVAVQTVRSESNIWAIAPAEEPGRARQITFGPGRNDGDPVTTPDGKIVYVSTAGGSWDLWIMDRDGSNQKQLTFDPLMEFLITVSPDGRSIAFLLSGQDSGENIWKMDADGSNRKQLTNGGMFPNYSPDGRWIVYTSPRDRWSLWKIPSDGGEPIRLTDRLSFQPAISPDGKLIAYVSVIQGEVRKIKVIPFDGGEPLNVFEAPAMGSSFSIAWAPDGQAISYNAPRNGGGQILSQPLSGGLPQQLIEFKSNRIGGLTWSRDGKQLFFAAGPVNSDVVLIRDSR
jgi:Tol biopolymer transport system component/DNA-binding winged helix-turn-helix (wHTH) protein